jgi:hypothetical protein
MCNVDVTGVCNDYSSKDMKVKSKMIEIDDNLLEIGMRKGLIEKSGDMYYFIGDYEDLIAFTNNKSKIMNKDWLD